MWPHWKLTLIPRNIAYLICYLILHKDALKVTELQTCWISLWCLVTARHLYSPDGARGGGQRRTKRPDVLFMLLYCGNADFERGYVRQEWPGWKEWLLPLSVLLGLQERCKLDLDYCAGKTKHTPRNTGWEGKERNNQIGEFTSWLVAIETHTLCCRGADGGSDRQNEWGVS